MKPARIVIHGALHASAVTVYIAAVSVVLYNAERWLGTQQSIWAPILFLLLFVLSAAVVALLIFGRPLLLYIDGERRQAVQLVLATLAWLAVFTAAILISRVWGVLGPAVWL